MNQEDFIKEKIMQTSIESWLQSCECINYIKSISTSKKFRFSDDYLLKQFPLKGNMKGNWNLGHVAMYEIENNFNSLIARCIIGFQDLTLEERNIVNSLNDIVSSNSEFVCLKEWNYSLNSVNDLENILMSFIYEDLMEFEKIDLFNSSDDELYFEGSSIDIYTNKYERNRNARMKCIEYYGAKCQICGFDFKETYGEQFKNIIEVHHIVPLNQIKDEYQVDPIKDLIPVCSNCHTALHSKKDGVYMPDELKKKLVIK